MRSGWWRLAAVAVSAVLALLSAVGAAAVGAEELEFEYERSFGPDGSNLSGFSAATSVAVDRVAGRVYVLDRVADAIYKFDLAGNPVDFDGSSPEVSGNKLSGLTIEDTAGGRQIAVDPISHRIYVPGRDLEGLGGEVLQAFEASGEPAEFTASPGGSNEISGFIGLRQIAVDAQGAIYTAERGNNTNGSEGFKVFAPSGAPLVSDPGPAAVVTQPNGIAVGLNGLLYIVRDFSIPTRFTPSVYPVTASTTYSPAGDISSKAAQGIAFDPILHHIFVAQRYEESGASISRVEVFDEAGNSEGIFGGPGEDGELKNAAGVAISVVNEATRAFVAHNPGGGGLSQVRIFNEKVLIGPPDIESTSASLVTGDSASLRGKVNPNNLDSTYWFEYGPEDCSVAVVPCSKAPVNGALIGAGRKGVIVYQALHGLQSQTLYHYRLVAENSEGFEAGPDRTFTTQGSGLGFELSDSRVWEMVSPPKKNGGELIASADAAIQASVQGDGLAFASLGALLEEPDGSRLPEPATVLARRANSGRWISVDLTPAHTLATQLRPDTEFNVFSPDLLRAEMEPRDDTPLSPQASERTPYLWEDGNPPLFEPLLTTANVPPGTEFGPAPGALKIPVRIDGATPDLEHVVVGSEKASLIEGAAPNSIYLWSGGQLAAVSRLPQSEGGAVVAGMLGSGRGSVRHAISDDGARVFWAPNHLGYSAAGIALPGLYLRDTAAEESVRLDVVKSGGGAGEKRPAFNAASADGSVVFFTDSQRLTTGASPSGRDLYRCEVGPAGSGQGCTDLTDITAPRVNPGESAGVLDQVSAISEDGTRLYFVARGVLDDEANEEGDVAVSGEPNLYLWEEGHGARFVASLSEADFLVWGGVLAPPKLGFAVRISASASPDGRYFTFTSERSVTGNENVNDDGEPNTEVFLFDAEASADQLHCLSCNPSGAAAVGEFLSADVEFFPPDPGGLWRNRWVAATLPEPTETEPEGRSLYRPRSVLSNGRVFFNSVDPLVPADSNDNWDVYQWQPLGVGSCTAQTSAAAAVRSGDGCVGLISSGTADSDAGFLDVTPSGNDVFFLTKGRLSVLDRDEQLDAYDARVNGIEAVLSPPQECAGEACQPSVGPPRVPTPASETFRGAETPVNCRKGQRKIKRNGKTLCVKKHKKHKKHHKKRAGKSGRAGR